MEKSEAIPQPSVPHISDVRCPSCHGESFTVLDTKTGLLRCDYCRNQWIDEHFIEVTETERFLREQAKQPKVVIDNTTDTDRHLMDMFSGLLGLPSILASLVNGLKNLVLIVVGAIVVLIAAYVALRYFGFLG